MDIFVNIPWITIIFGAVILVMFLVYWHVDLPGPYGLPYFGQYPFFIGDDFHIRLMKMAQNRFGDVFFFRITGQLFVHLATTEAVREAHVRKADCFSARMRKFSVPRMMFDLGLIFEEGEKWKVQRKFFLQSLRELSNKEALNDPVQKAIREVVEVFRKSKYQSINLLKVLSVSCTDVVSQICFTINNEEFVKKLTDAYTKAISVSSPEMLFVCGPFFKYVLAPWLSKYKKVREGRNEMLKLLHKYITQREAVVRAGSMEDNLVDLFLQEKISREQKGDSQAEFFSKTSLAASLIQLFGDSSVGVASYLASILGDLAPKIDVQLKMRKEIIQELGNKEFPLWEDRVKLPYVNGVIKELMRCNAIFPVFATNECTRETTVSGVRIPVGSVTVTNFWAINHDPNVYENPDEFQPERFLYSSSSDRKPLIFGMGRRSCVGESMTFMMMFCFIAAIVRNFELRLTKDSELIDRTSTHFLNDEVFAIPVET